MGGTLSQYYTSKGQALPSLADRGKLFESYGLGSAVNYKGTADQNTQLLAKLSGGSSSPPPQVTTAAVPKVNSVQEATTHLNNVQTNLYTANSEFTSGFNKSDLISALVSKGYNQKDAENAANGSRGAELAKEYLGTTSSQLPQTSAPSYEQIKDQVAPDIARPETLNRVEMLNSLRTEYKLPDLESRLNELKSEEAAILDERAQRKSANAGKPVALGVIGGRETEIEKQAREKLDSIALQKSVVTDELNTKYGVINTLIQFAGLDYQDAVENYDSQFNQNMSVYKLMREGETDARDAAKANLSIIANAITAGNTTYADLSSDQKTNITKLEVQAGLPVGTIGSLQMSAKDKLLGFSDDKTQAMIVGSDGSLKVVQTGFTKSSSSKADTKADLSNKVLTLLNSNKNSYGHVSPSVWQQIMNAYIGDGGDKSSFISNFSQFTDPNRGDFKVAYGFDLTQR